MERYRAEYRPTRCGHGQVHIEGRDGRAFHGALGDQSHRFVVEQRRGELGPFAWHATTGPWNPLSQTYERATDFCSNCRFIRQEAERQIYECQGHAPEDAEGGGPALVPPPRDPQRACVEGGEDGS